MLRAELVASGLALCAAVAAQPVLDTFGGGQLDPRWTVDSARGATVAVEPDREVLLLTGPEHYFNHVETPLPARVPHRVQIDVCSVNDVAASWAPSLILYWDKTNYVRLMFSLFYSLKLEARAEGVAFGEVNKVPLEMGVWQDWGQPNCKTGDSQIVAM